MRSVFDSQLDLLDAQLLVMGTSMEDALRAAIGVLGSRDVSVACKIMEGDDEIDRMEREVEDLCLKLLLTQQPVAGDLRRVSAALKMVGDMERIADQAADIAETVLMLNAPFDEQINADLCAMGEKACAMVHAAIDAFVAHDETAAHDVIGADLDVNEMFDQVKNEIVQRIKDDEEPAGNLAEMLMVAKYLERVGDHAQNIAEWVEYCVTGIYKGEMLG